MRRSQTLLIGGWLLAVVVLAPVLSKPLIAFGLAFILLVFGLAWKSVAYPLGLAGVPNVIVGLLGHDPLPKGGTTVLFFVWIGAAVTILLMRGEGNVGLRGAFSLPVAMALALLALMMLRLGPSGDQAYGMQKIEMYFTDNIVFMIGAVFAGADRRTFQLFLALILGITSIEAVYLIIQILGGASQAFAGRYTVSSQAGPIELGRDGATGTLIAMYLILATAPGRLRTASIVALPLCLITLVAAGSRGPVVAFVAGLVTLLALAAGSPQARRRLMVVMASVVGTAILVPFIVPGSAIGRSLSTIIGSASGLSSNGRSSLWADAYNVLGQHSLFGIGTGGFGSLNLGYPYPHNILLEIGLELGAVGLLIFGVMAGSMGLRLVRLWRETEGNVRLSVSVVIALLVSALVNAFFSGALPDNSDLWKWGGVAIGMYAHHEFVARGRGRGRSWA